MAEATVRLGDRLADAVAGFVGSWSFITMQSIGIALWVTINTLHHVYHWDGYPFIFLNLALSFQAAFTAPVIMISQNRQAAQQQQMFKFMLHLMQAVYAQNKVILDEIEEDEDDEDATRATDKQPD